MYKQTLEEYFKENEELLSKVESMHEINFVRFTVNNDKEEDPALNLTKDDSPGTLEIMLNTINFIGVKISPDLQLSYIRRSKSYNDGIEIGFKTKPEDVIVVSNAIGIAGVALSNYLKRVRKNFNLEPYL